MATTKEVVTHILSPSQTSRAPGGKSIYMRVDAGAFRSIGRIGRAVQDAERARLALRACLEIKCLQVLDVVDLLR